jgi:hypothetical protein
MVTAPMQSGYRTRLIGLLAQKSFSGLYVTKDNDEAQALTRGFFKVKWGRGYHASNHGQACQIRVSGIN